MSKELPYCKIIHNHQVIFFMYACLKLLESLKPNTRQESFWNRTQDRHQTVTSHYSSHYYLYSAFNNANQLDIKLGGFTSALQYLDGEIVCRNGVILLWPDKISSLNLGCSLTHNVQLYFTLLVCKKVHLGIHVYDLTDSR